MIDTIISYLTTKSYVIGAFRLTCDSFNYVQPFLYFQYEGHNEK